MNKSIHVCHISSVYIMNVLERRKWAKLNLNFVMDHAAINAVENVTKNLYRVFIDKYLATGERKIFLLKFLH